MRAFTLRIASIFLALGAAASGFAASAKHSFVIGTNDFLLDGKPMQIRCGEIHFARVPRDYWKQRLQLCHAMGLNTVCAYLFWNYHEWEPGKFVWDGQADAAEFCREAQAEGLWVILRPGPYACAEWDGGGLPWWLLRTPDIHLRSQDPVYLAASTAWLKEVGRVLGPEQITRGGPILMVQVENEYGSYGKDVEYMGKQRQALVDAGFSVPLFACNPGDDIRNGYRSDLFQVVNFGSDPNSGFRKLRAVQPTGPLMCGEFYPGWFDTWGAPHHLGNTPRYLADLENMLKRGASFSIYMAHGGTTFGMWSGTDRPFKPDTSSYDYDAPISEAGWVGDKFRATRDLISKYLAPGEKLPEPGAPNPVMSVAPFTVTESAALLDNLPKPVLDDTPRNMEAYDQGRGCILYRTTISAGPAAVLEVGQPHDFMWVMLDGKQVGVLDRRFRRHSLNLPERAAPSQLDILVEAAGHVNYGNEIHDRKGLQGSVTLEGAQTNKLTDWQIYRFGMEPGMFAHLHWRSGEIQGPGFWRGHFDVDKPQDTFLDLRSWGKGVVWINGHCLARFWNIGPTQTAYIPAPWLRPGRNEVVVFDVVGPSRPELGGLEKPILNELHPEKDFNHRPVKKGHLALDGRSPVFAGGFDPGTQAQEVHFAQPVEGRQFCFEALNSQDGKPFAAIAELDLLDADGKSIPHMTWTIAYADSEELSSEDGSALNAINGQTADYWHTAWSNEQPGYPHQIVIDLGAPARIGGFRYTPRSGENSPGHIKDYRVFVGSGLVREANP